MHEDGDIFIKEIEYYASSFNTLQINSKQLIETGITKDNITFKECKTIDEYLIRLTYIIIKAESDLYGGIQISDFDFLLAEAINKNYRLICLNNIDKFSKFNNINAVSYTHLTNSSHLPVGYTESVSEALKIQDRLQVLYTSGTVFHAFLGQKLQSWQAAANAVSYTHLDVYKRQDAHRRDQGDHDAVLDHRGAFLFLHETLDKTRHSNILS